MRWRKCLGVFAVIIAMASFVTPIEAANVVFVGDFDGDEGGDGGVPEYAAADASMLAHMTNVLGHTVTSIDQVAVTAAAVAGADFIVISSTASSGNIGVNDSGDGNTGAVNSLGTSATIVLMESGNNIVVPFELAGVTFGTHIGVDFEIVVLDGYLTNTFELGTLTIYDNPEFGGEEIRGWGVTPPNGADVGFPEADFTGDLLLGSAPTVGFEPVVLGTHTIGDNTIIAFPFGNGGFDHLTADGLQLFNNLFATQELRADFDSDNDVDGGDFLAWQRGFGTLAPNATKPDGDANADTAVTDFDLTVWERAFGFIGTGALSAAVVPEPSTLLCCGMGFASLLAFGRRQTFP